MPNRGNEDKNFNPASPAIEQRGENESWSPP